MPSMLRRDRRSDQPIRAPPDFTVTKSENYQLVYSTGIFGGVNPNDGHLIFYCDRMEPEMDRQQLGRMQATNIHRELQVEVHMSPSQFKTMARFMTERVRMLEERIGQLKEQEEDDAPSHIS